MVEVSSSGYIYGCLSHSDSSSRICTPCFNGDTLDGTSACSLAVYQKTDQGIVRLNNKKSSRAYLYIKRGDKFKVSDARSLVKQDKSTKEVFVYAQKSSGRYIHKQTHVVQKPRNVMPSWAVIMVIIIVILLIACACLVIQKWTVSHDQK